MAHPEPLAENTRPPVAGGANLPVSRVWHPLKEKQRNTPSTPRLRGDLSQFHSGSPLPYGLPAWRRMALRIASLALAETAWVLGGSLKISFFPGRAL